MKKKAKKRKANRRVVAVLLAALLAVVGIALSLTVFFKVNAVLVEGDLTVHTEEEIRALAGIKIGGNLFRFNARAKEKAIWSTLPYIESVKITRKLPGTVVIKVKEIKYLFSVPTGTGYAVVSDKLKILDITSNPPEHLIELTGVEAVDPVKGETLTAKNVETSTFFMTLAQTLDAYDLLSKVTAIDVTDKLNYRLIYDNRLDCMIGTANHLDYKMNMLAEVVSNKLKLTDTGFLDLATAGKATFKPGDIFGEASEEHAPPDEEQSEEAETTEIESAPSAEE